MQLHNLKNRNTALFCKANYPSMYILHATLHFLHKTWRSIRKRRKWPFNPSLCLIQVVQLRSRILSLLLLFLKAINISMVNMLLLGVSALPFLSFFVHRKCGRIKVRNVYQFELKCSASIKYETLSNIYLILSLHTMC